MRGKHSDDSAGANLWIAAGCAPRPGPGILLRKGPIVLLTADADEDLVASLVAHTQMVADNGGHARQLVRGFALQLTDLPDDPPAFLALAPVPSGLAVFVSGSATVTADGEEITARDSLAWVERILPWPIQHVEGRVDAGASSDSGLLDLRDGVVRAGGFTMSLVPHQGSMPRRATGKSSEASMPPPDEPREVEPETPGRDAGFAPRPSPPPAAAEFESVLFLDLKPDEVESAEALPIVQDHADLEVSIAESKVFGVFCKRHHFNDPRMLFCAVCGINMVQQTPVLVDGKRPPLGVIVLDDGAVFQLDVNYLLGRDPQGDELVITGKFQGIALADPANLISRVHARLELRHWDVVLVDNASTNGSFFAEPGSASWQRLPTSGEQTLAAGTRIRLGSRTLAFNTHRGV